MSRSKFRDPAWWRGLLTEGFGGDFRIFLLVAIGCGALVYFLKGPDIFAEAVADDLDMVLETVPRIVAALAISGLLWVLVPRDRLARLIGRESSLRGLLIAVAAGTLTPGGPSSAYSILALLAGAGADRGALVTYIAAWSMMGLQRILVWDVPFMGAEFSLVRFAISLPLAILAGLIARALPLALRLPENLDDAPGTRVRP